MNATTHCLEVRRVLGAEPQRRDAALLAHCESCATCATFLRDMQTLDVRLERALAIPVPEGLEARIVLDASLRHSSPLRPTTWLALAASLVLAVAIGFGLWWQATPATPTLASALVQHVTNPAEADALDSHRPVITAAGSVSRVLKKVGVAVNGKLPDVTYARACLFRGRLVAHLVVRGKNGPVTIMLLPHVHVSRSEHFNEEGYRGMIEPAGSGSIAILANNPSPMQPMAVELARQVQWQL